MHYQDAAFYGFIYRLAFTARKDPSDTRADEPRFDSSISPVATVFQFAEAKMNAKAVVAASTTIVGAAAIVGAERRPRGYYHNFIISSFQGSLPPVSRQQHLNARRTRYRPRFCVSLVFLVRLLAGRLFLLVRRRIR
jgi:hypothetical protein